jgi:hypothetical protein
MSFGFEEKKVPLPYVESKNAVHGEVPEFPKFKYHEKYPQGLLIETPEEEVALGDGWHDTPAAFGVETHPSVDKRDPLAVRLAEVREAVKRTKAKKAKE